MSWPRNLNDRVAAGRRRVTCAAIVPKSNMNPSLLLGVSVCETVPNLKSKFQVCQCQWYSLTADSLGVGLGI